MRNTDLVQLVAQVYGVDVVGFQIGEHDDLHYRRLKVENAG